MATRLSPELVVETAARLADEGGLDTVTLTSVAAALGVQQPALYRHVEGFDDLIRALSLRGRAALTASLSEAAVGRAGDDAVVAMAHAWRSFVQHHPGLYEATDRVPTTGDADMESAVDQVVAVLSRALEGYGLDPNSRVHAARALRSALHGFCHLEMNREHPAPVDLDESYDHLVALVCTGVAAITQKASYA
ncbi:MAG: WHG domain-containing protein [Actinomycetota bacterium]|nr:WHG domain-containing protein [Actinomycetota bacterium]